MPVKYFKYTFASAATATGSMYIGNAARMWVMAPDTQSWNAGAGNTTIQIRGGNASGVTHFPLPSVTVATANSGIWTVHDAAGVPFISIGFGTAVTGGSANSIFLITADDAYL